MNRATPSQRDDRLESLEDRFSLFEERVVVASEKAAQHREQISGELGKIRITLALRDQENGQTLAKVQEISNDVKLLTKAFDQASGRTQIITPIIDLIFKVVTTLIAAFLLWRYGLK